MNRKMYFMLVAALLVAGCSTMKHDLGNIGLLDAPPDLSTVFFSNDGKLYIVPEKGVVIEEIKNPAGGSVEWSASGSYVVVNGMEVQGLDYVSILIEGRHRMIRLNPGSSQAR